MSGAISTYSFTHNTELEINPNDTRKVIGVVPIFCATSLITAYGWNLKNNGNIGVTIQFSAGSGTSDCKILILFS
jgi:hypothetical protein